MSRRCKLLLAALVAAGVLVALLAHLVYRLGCQVHINPDTCSGIKPGMTWADMEALLGGPLGGYTTGHYITTGFVYVGRKSGEGVTSLLSTGEGSCAG